MDLSFARLSPPTAEVAPPQDAAVLLAALAAYRCAVQRHDRHLLAPADGSFNGHVARLLTAWQG